MAIQAGSHSITRLRMPFLSPQTTLQYSLWLDDHSEAEALAFIAAAVMAGEAALKQRGQGEDATLAAMRMVLQAHAPPAGA